MGERKMYKFKKLVIYLAMISLLSSIFLGCTRGNYQSQDYLSTEVSIDTISKNQNDEKDEVVSSNLESSKLESWLGEYTFSEFAPPDQNMNYYILIDKDDENYYAQIDIDGFQTMARLKARVIGDENCIQLIFEEYLPDNLLEPYNKGDVLLSLKKENGKLYTLWDNIQPMLESSIQKDSICFSSYSGYNPKNNNDENISSGNIQNELLGIWHASPSVGAGYSERFFFYDDGTYKFYYSQYDETKRILDESGKWNIDGEKLVLSMTQETVLVGGETAEASPSSTSKYSIVDATVEKINYDTPEVTEYSLRQIEEDDESPYGTKILINGQYYWKLSDDPYVDYYSE